MMSYKKNRPTAYIGTSNPACKPGAWLDAIGWPYFHTVEIASGKRFHSHLEHICYAELRIKSAVSYTAANIRRSALYFVPIVPHICAVRKPSALRLRTYNRRIR